jgi:hypothetical protein
MDNSVDPTKAEYPSQGEQRAIEPEIIPPKANHSHNNTERIKAVINTEPSSNVAVGGREYRNKGVEQEDLSKAVDDAKKDFITIFGLFAALLIFLSIEVQVFQQVKKFSYVMGVSFFLLAAILMFVLAIHSLFNDERKYGRYWPVFSLIILFFVASAACFLWGIEHTLAFWKLFRHNPHTT